jgi:hypothetical protein
VAAELEEDDKMTVANTLTAQVGDLKKELNEKKQNERAQESKVKDIEK